jgi:DNA-directed RNA polymerase
MNDNELEMKMLGEKKVWKTILTKSGNLKNISSIQLGQQLLLEEGLSILGDVRTWIEEGSGVIYRKELKAYFVDDEILLQKIVESFLFLSGAIYNSLDAERSKANKTRHKKINALKTKVMPELSFDQVWRFLEIIIEFSKYFQVDKDFHYKEGKPICRLKYATNLSEVILEKLTVEATEAFYPMPITHVPIDWKREGNGVVGGYKDYQYELIRAASQNLDYSLYSERVFDAVNYIQSTPWIVNEPLLKIVREDLQVPKKDDYVKSEFPDAEPSRWDVDIEDERLSLSKVEVTLIQLERKAYREKIALLDAEKGDFESALGKYRAVRLALNVAERYVGKVIYFPHSYDFRGRIYPLPIGLTPQGSDAVKSLLLYRDTEELTEQGSNWNWAYLASLYGDDKLPFLERIERGKELLTEDYKEADEPYQFLSHQMELRKWIEDKNYIPNTRIHLDACNSGSQFTSAITGDRDGCIATNVIPTVNKEGGQDRKDAYLLVADKALELACKMSANTKDREQKVNLEFLKGLLEEDGRKICKVPVMVSNYGGTTGGRTEILWHMLRELGVERKWITRKVATLFSKVIGDSIVGVLKGGKAFEIYIHQMNNIITRKNKAIKWTTGDGFHVIHIKNKELKTRQVACVLPGARRSTTITKKVYSDKVSASKMKSAISPNYIHSLDAELLRRVALKLKRNGIKESDWIHDSFGCHPNNVDLMLDITKREFSKLIRKTPLRTLDAQLRSQIGEDKVSQKMLSEVTMPHLKGFEAMAGGLDVVMDSDWFFS